MDSPVTELPAPAPASPSSSFTVTATASPSSSFTVTATASPSSSTVAVPSSLTTTPSSSTAPPSSSTADQPNAAERVDITAADLPLHCPLPGKRLWDSHPRVFLPITAGGEEVCPYCGTRYVFAAADSPSAG